MSLWLNELLNGTGCGTIDLDREIRYEMNRPECKAGLELLEAATANMSAESKTGLDRFRDDMQMRRDNGPDTAHLPRQTEFKCRECGRAKMQQAKIKKDRKKGKYESRTLANCS